MNQISKDCLVCETGIPIPTDVMKSELVACLSCGQEHEIVEVGEKLKIDLAPEVEEDWGE